MHSTESLEPCFILVSLHHKTLEIESHKLVNMRMKSMLSGGVKFTMPVINTKFLSNIFTLTYFTYLGFFMFFNKVL